MILKKNDYYNILENNGKYYCQSVYNKDGIRLYSNPVLTDISGMEKAEFDEDNITKFFDRVEELINKSSSLVGHNEKGIYQVYAIIKNTANYLVSSLQIIQSDMFIQVEILDVNYIRLKTGVYNTIPGVIEIAEFLNNLENQMIELWCGQYRLHYQHG